MVQSYYGSNANDSFHANLYESWSILGYGGHDVLIGGEGADWFYKGEGDTIADFQEGIDTIFIV